VAQVCTDLGHVARKQGDLPRARALYRESLVLAQQFDVYRPHLADTLEGLAMASVASGELQYATRLLGAAGALREALNAPRAPHGRAEYERQATAARTHLDDTTFAAVWSEGRAMTLEQVITYAVMGDECPPT
jgi:hypothetical protein